MIMSNFINETERHTELYQAYSPRQKVLLNLVNNLVSLYRDNRNIDSFLIANQVSISEIHWLKRNGHYLPGS